MKKLKVVNFVIAILIIGSLAFTNKMPPQTDSSGLVTLINGKATIYTTKVTGVCKILCTPQNMNGVLMPQAISVYKKENGTYFSIMSGQSSDQSTIAWEIVD